MFWDADNQEYFCFGMFLTYTLSPGPLGLVETTDVYYACLTFPYCLEWFPSYISIHLHLSRSISFRGLSELNHMWALLLNFTRYLIYISSNTSLGFVLLRFGYLHIFTPLLFPWGGERNFVFVFLVPSTVPRT